MTSIRLSPRDRATRIIGSSASSLLADFNLSSSIGVKNYNDLHRLTVSGLFRDDGTPLRGNLKTLPDDLPRNGKATLLDKFKLASSEDADEPMILVGRSLADGRILVIGRNVQELVNLQEAVGRALALGVIPMALLALGAGAILSQRMNRRLKSAQRALDDIQRGRLHRRLPVSAANDEIDHLAEGVNVMLAELEQAIHELHHVGNNIAHNLRTPLARARAHLEHAQRLVSDRTDVIDLLERALSGLNQTISITTAMLRIVQLEAGRARASFREVDLAELLQEVTELYGPLAEEKDTALTLTLNRAPYIRGDRDLLLEALASLADNAIKFTPGGGRIHLTLADSAQGPLIEVRDSGPGIPPEHRLSVFKRFYRANQSPNIPGNGLGLTLVAAVVKLHGFSIEIKDASPGCIFQVKCFASAKTASVASKAPT